MVALLVEGEASTAQSYFNGLSQKNKMGALRDLHKNFLYDAASFNKHQEHDKQINALGCLFLEGLSPEGRLALFKKDAKLSAWLFEMLANRDEKGAKKAAEIFWDLYTAPKPSLWDKFVNRLPFGGSSVVLKYELGQTMAKTLATAALFPKKGWIRSNKSCEQNDCLYRNYIYVNDVSPPAFLHDGREAFLKNLLQGLKNDNNTTQGLIEIFKEGVGVNWDDYGYFCEVEKKLLVLFLLSLYEKEGVGPESLAEFFCEFSFKESALPILCFHFRTLEGAEKKAISFLQTLVSRVFFNKFDRNLSGIAKDSSFLKTSPEWIKDQLKKTFFEDLEYLDTSLKLQITQKLLEKFESTQKTITDRIQVLSLDFSASEVAHENNRVSTQKKKLCNKLFPKLKTELLKLEGELKELQEKELQKKSEGLSSDGTGS